jgi:hypothetical protein
MEEYKMSEKIVITNLNEKQSSNDKIYWIAKLLDNRQVTIWEQEMADKVKGVFMKEVDAEIQINGNYKNLKKIDITTAKTVNPPINQTPQKIYQFEEPMNQKNSGMILSYIKDVLIETMKLHADRHKEDDTLFDFEKVYGQITKVTMDNYFEVLNRIKKGGN